MTEIRLAELAEACGARFRSGSRELPADEARKVVRSWLKEMESELERRLDAEHAPALLRRQLREALEAVRASSLGVLSALTAARPRQQRYQEYGQGQPTQDWASGQKQWAERLEQQDQQPGGPNWLGRIFGAGPGPDHMADQPRQADRAPAVLLTETLYQQLLSACEALDRVLKIASPPAERPVVPWAKTSEFLVEAQKLFAAYIQGNGELALHELELLENRLKARFGIEVVRADEDTHQFFTLYSNELPEDGSHETRKPAILVDGRVVLRGEALGPVQNPPGIFSADRSPTIPVQPLGSAGAEDASAGEGGQVSA